MERDYLKGVQIERVTPPPDKAQVQGDAVVYSFPFEEAKESLDITFAFTPEAVGLLDGGVGLDGGPILRFRQFFYP